MTELQILDLQLSNRKYYWFQSIYEKPGIMQYYYDKELDTVDLYIPGSEVSLDLKNIISIDPHFIQQ